MNTTIWFI